jgi:hypothetical protein
MNMDEMEPWEDSEKPKPHRLQAFLDYYDHNNKKATLTDKQTEKLLIMQQTRAWRVQNIFSPSDIVAELMEKNGISQSQAYAIMKDADFIFGKMDLLNKDAERSVQYELLHFAARLIKNCAKSNDLEKGLALIKAVDKMAELSGTKDLTENFDPIKAMAPVSINFMVVQSPEPNKIIDIEHETEP